jgi:hypothetical protein
VGAQHEEARLLSNKTHYSPTDPDARIFIKPGKACALNYLCSQAVDTACGVISHVQAYFADSRDSLPCTCLGCSPACSSDYGPTSCACTTSWLMRATPTARTMPCSKRKR